VAGRPPPPARRAGRAAPGPIAAPTAHAGLCWPGGTTPRNPPGGLRPGSSVTGP